MLVLRRYRTEDGSVLARLFYDTVHNINCRDYTKEQIDAWATEKFDLHSWSTSFQKNYTIVAEINGTIVGFGDISKKGYLDRLYVHKDYQGKGIASEICDKLEQSVKGNVETHASVTARPFFEKRGYRIIKEQQVERRGIKLTNFVMMREK